MTATSVGGAISADYHRLDRARLESVSGNVTFSGSLAVGGALEMETHGGDLSLRFRGPVNAEFDLLAVGGNIVNRLAKLSAGAASGGKPVRFVIGKGTAQVTARTFKGTITVGN